MKYNLKYPDMKLIFDDRDGVIRGESSKPCHWCEELTEFVDINYETHFCSDDCLHEFEFSIFGGEDD